MFFSKALDDNQIEDVLKATSYRTLILRLRSFSNLRKLSRIDWLKA